MQGLSVLLQRKRHPPSRGTVSEVPIRWIYYHVADQQGRQAVFAFVVEEKFYDRLGEKDQKLVDSFRFKEAEK